MKLNNKGISVINLIIVIATLGIFTIGCYFGIKTMIINTKKDNFINTAKEYVEGAKQQLLSENMMPNSGEGMIVPYEYINLGKEYLSPYSKGKFSEDYSYVVIVKNHNQDAEYKYYVTQIDSLGNCINLIDYDKINNYKDENRKLIIHDNSCNMQSIELVDPDFKIKNIKLDFDIKYYKYQK